MIFFNVSRSPDFFGIPSCQPLEGFLQGCQPLEGWQLLSGIKVA
jgi:hypothetical protein